MRKKLAEIPTIIFRSRAYHYPASYHRFTSFPIWSKHHFCLFKSKSPLHASSTSSNDSNWRPLKKCCIDQTGRNQYQTSREALRQVNYNYSHQKTLNIAKNQKKSSNFTLAHELALQPNKRIL